MHLPCPPRPPRKEAEKSWQKLEENGWFQHLVIRPFRDLDFEEIDEISAKILKKNICLRT